MKDMKKVALAVVLAAGLGAGLYYQDVYASAPATGMDKEKSALNQKLTNSIEDYKAKANDPNASSVTKSLNGAMQKVLEGIRTLTDKFSAAAEKTVGAVKSLASTVVSIFKYSTKMIGDLSKGVKNTLMVGIAREQKLFEENLVDNIVRSFVPGLLEKQEGIDVQQAVTLADFESKRTETLDRAALLNMARKLYADAANRLQMLETFQKDVVAVLVAQAEAMKTKATEAATSANIKLPQSVLDAINNAVPGDIKKALDSIRIQVINHLKERRAQLTEVGYLIGAVDEIPAALKAKVEAKLKEIAAETPEVREQKLADSNTALADDLAFLDDLEAIEIPKTETVSKEVTEEVIVLE